MNKAGIWLDPECTLVVHKDDRGIRSDKITPGKFLLLKNLTHHFLHMLNPLGNQRNGHAHEVKASDRNYLKEIIRSTGKVDELYVFGNQDIEVDFNKELENLTKFKPIKMEIYPVNGLSPEFRFRQIKAFLN